MSDFYALKKQFDCEPEPPAHFPDLFAPCVQCAKNTPTKILFMHQGLGNACACCGCLRPGKPYISKCDFNALKPDAAKGGADEDEARTD